MTEKKELRILAAIMFTDIVGYTKMMQNDEAIAKSNRQKHRKILEKYLDTHLGRNLEFYGDGSLSIFGSAIEAVQCAVKIQKEFIQNDLPIRIGIHLGDVIYEDDSVIGDGINISSRVQSIGVEGSILISDKVYIELKNHKSLKANYLGHFDLKNVEDTLGIYCIVNKDIYVPESHELEIKGQYVQNSIAVLPFVNMSSDSENEFFSDGLTEEILNVLVKIDGLKVTSRTSSFAYKDKKKDITEIGEELGVSHILEGSVRKSEDNVRITAQLINVKNDFHIWSETYDHIMENVFELQDEISGNIANVLAEKFDLKSPISLNTKQNLNYEAYQFYLKGKYHWNKWTPDNARLALENFQSAIDLQADYAEAYAGLSNCYSMLGAMGQEDPAIMYPKANLAAYKSIELNPNLAESHTSIAINNILFNWKWDEAKFHIDEAMRLDSKSSETLYSYAFYLISVKKRKKAIKVMEKSVYLDPLSLNKLNFLGYCYLLNQNYEKANYYFDQVLDMDPDFRAARDNKARSYLHNGRYEEALALNLMNKKYHDDKYKGITPLITTYHLLGDRKNSKNYFDLLKENYELNGDKLALEMDLVFVYASLKKYKKAIKFLKIAVKKKIGSVIFMMNEPYFDEFINQKEVKEILMATGLLQFIEKNK